MRRQIMQAKQTQPTTVTIAPMKGPTYAEALYYILRTPRRATGILDFFSPDEEDRALAALYELHALGAVEWKDGLYSLPCKRSVS